MFDWHPAWAAPKTGEDILVCIYGNGEDFNEYRVVSFRKGMFRDSADDKVEVKFDFWTEIEPPKLTSSYKSALAGVVPIRYITRAEMKKLYPEKGDD